LGARDEGRAAVPGATDADAAGEARGRASQGFDSEHARQLFAAEEDGGTAEAECDFEKEGLGELCLK